MHVPPVAGGHREDETVGRPSSWTGVIGVSSSPLPVLGTYILPSSHSGSCLPEHSHERAVSGWTIWWHTWLNPGKASYKVWCEHVWRSTGLAATHGKPRLWVPFLMRPSTCQSGLAPSLLPLLVLCVGISQITNRHHPPASGILIQ